MPLVIKLSQIKSAADFEAQVAAYIKARKDHQKTEGEPAPTAPPIVEAAVMLVPGSIEDERADDYVADYQVVDDSPTLDARKAAVHALAVHAVNAAIDAISPPLLRRLASLTANAAAAVAEGSRTQAQEAAIAKAVDTHARVEAIYLQLAYAEAAIHGLTAETIDAWKVPPFGG